MNRGNKWTEAEAGRLEILYAEGHLLAEIGRRMRRTKESVMGKVCRLGLVARGSPVKPRSAPAPVRPVRSVPLPALTAGLAPQVVPPHLNIIRPPQVCVWPEWPFGVKPTHQYCGAAPIPSKPYCPVHHDLAWGAPK